ncbi:hypothetical protein ACWDKQ_28185 [Saccharopolyspora sp. NPDC000995]
MRRADIVSRRIRVALNFMWWADRRGQWPPRPVLIFVGSGPAPGPDRHFGDMTYADG